MSIKKKNIEQQLTLAGIAIDNALAESSLAEALAGFGYTAERVRQGGALRENALALYQRHKGAHGDSQTPNDAHAAALAVARETYMRFVKVARVALEGERGMLQTLSLAGERKHIQAEQLVQAQQFYANALYDTTILGKLNAFGITQEMLAAGQRQFDAVAQADAARRQLLQMLGLNAPAARRAARPSSSAIAIAEVPAVETAAPLPESRALAFEDRNLRSSTARRNGTKFAAVAE